MPDNKTAQAYTPLATTPDIGPIEAAKLAFAPNVKVAGKYLQDKGYNLTALGDSEGNPVLNDVSDLWIIPKDAPDNIDNDYIYAYGRQVTPGILGTVAHEAAPTLFSTAAGLGGGFAGAPLGPWGIGVGSTSASAAGNVAGEKVNKKIQSALWKTSPEMSWPEIGKAAAVGAGQELLGRYVVAPLIEGRLGLGKAQDWAGEKLSTALGEKPEIVPVGGQKINVSKMTKGSLPQQEMEVAKASEPFMNALQQAKKAIPAQKNKIEQDALNALKRKGFDYWEMLDEAASYVDDGLESYRNELIDRLNKADADMSPETFDAINAELKSVDQTLTKSKQQAERRLTSATEKAAAKEDVIPGQTYEDLAETISKEVDPQKLKEIELASGMYKKYFDVLRESKTYSDMTDEQLYDIIHSDNFINDALVNLESELLRGRKSGASWEDLAGANPRWLKYAYNLVKAKAKQGIIPQESADQMAAAIREIGDLQAKMKGLQRIQKQFPELAKKSTYSAPINYPLRGAEAMAGAGVRSAVPAYNIGYSQISPMLYNQYGRMQPSIQDMERARKAALPKNLSNKLRGSK